jgi:hypothetical protein
MRRSRHGFSYAPITRSVRARYRVPKQVYSFSGRAFLLALVAAGGIATLDITVQPTSFVSRFELYGRPAGSCFDAIPPSYPQADFVRIAGACPAPGLAASAGPILMNVGAAGNITVNGNVTASSSDPNVATVNVSGSTITVSPTQLGTATVTIAGSDGQTESVPITVTAPR